jgi:hypothetical protein
MLVLKPNGTHERLSALNRADQEIPGFYENITSVRNKSPVLFQMELRFIETVSLSINVSVHKRWCKKLMYVLCVINGNF